MRVLLEEFNGQIGCSKGLELSAQEQSIHV